MTDTTRPIFKINNHVYLSAGIIFYFVDDKDIIHFMFQKVKGTPWLYEDFGGKSQYGDKSLKDVAIRECLEELNQGDDTKKNLESSPCIEYLVPNNKYVSYFININDIFENKFTELPSTEVFGDREVLYNIERTVVWLTYAELWNLHPSLIHPRLQPDFKTWLPLLLN